MVDRRRIVRQWHQGQGKVLVTLVRTEGSSYRRRGAHMLVGPEGENFGTISGGCLESEVVRKATWAIRNGPVVERYSTLFDDTAEIPYGLGCGGVVDLLLEPIDTPECTALLEAMQRSLAGSESTAVTLLPAPNQPLARIVVRDQGEIAFASSHLTQAQQTGLASLAEGSEGTLSKRAYDRVYIERLTAPQRLVLLGAGDDAKPAVSLASMLGWSVLVFDGRTQFARPERFPEAERVASTGSAWNTGLRISDAVVLMSHSYEQDRACLQTLLAPVAAGEPDRVPGYIGLLGARHRSALLVSEASAALGLTVSECCNRIWAPVGLDLGGDGPEAIALAVIAEIQSWVQGKLAGSRRLTPDDVVKQIAKGGASIYLQSQCAMNFAPR